MRITQEKNVCTFCFGIISVNTVDAGANLHLIAYSRGESGYSNVSVGGCLICIALARTVISDRTVPHFSFLVFQLTS